MSKVRQEKIVSSLPSTLTKDTIYYVRVGIGFDVYLTNGLGTIVAYKLNTQTAVSITSSITPSNNGDVFIGAKAGQEFFFLEDSTLLGLEFTEGDKLICKVDIINTPTDFSNFIICRNYTSYQMSDNGDLIIS